MSNRIGDTSHVIASVNNADFTGDGKVNAIELDNLFAFADVTHSGKIEKSELRLFLRREFPKISDDQIDQAFKKFDTDKSGKISQNEFNELFKVLFPNKIDF